MKSHSGSFVRELISVWPYCSLPWCAVLVFLGFGLNHAVLAQTLGPSFTGLYSIKDVGFPVTGQSGSQLVFTPTNSGVLLIGNSVGQGDAKLYKFQVTRDSGSHISGVVQSSTVVADAHALDGTAPFNAGMAFGPGNTLFFVGSDPFSFGQIKAGSNKPDQVTELDTLGYGGALGGGGMGLVPVGLPGAGRLKLIHDNQWYDTTLAAAGNGLYTIPTFTGTPLALTENSAVGICFIPAGAPGFVKNAVLIGDTAAGASGGAVSAYDLDSNGNPVLSTRRSFVTGVDGVAINVDPVTGDLIFIGNDPPHIFVASRVLTPPPVVRITDPPSGTVVEPGSISFSITADQTNGVISEVRLYSGTQLLSSVQNVGASHYQNTLGSTFVAGNYAITAVALDGSGQSATSSVVNITVGYHPPVIALTSPLNGQSFLACSTIPLSAVVTNGSGLVTNVEYFLNGVKVAQSGTAPFRAAVSDLPLGTYALTARATDNLGTPGNTASAVTINVSQSVGQLSARQVSADSVQICFVGIPGTNYVLESSSDLTPPILWSAIMTNPAPASTVLQFRDSGVSTGRQRFYRVHPVR